jgi:oxaloacetate decarboxylase alpha subunit
LSPITYTVAADLVDVLQVACGPLSNGSSLPDAQRVVANLRELGHTVDVDDRLLGKVADYFHRLAEAESLPSGTPQEYDTSFLRHQVAGGVLSTTRRQLRELDMEPRFDAVMEEVGQVRAELGYPIMVTPFPQMVCSQALFNVIGTERYANVPDQVIRYVLGNFGRPAGPIDPDVRDRILGLPRARELASEPPAPTPAELRKQFGSLISDEELLLRATMPADQVDAMVASGPAQRHYTPEAQQVLRLVDHLAARQDLVELTVEKPGLSITARYRKESVVDA